MELSKDEVLECEREISKLQQHLAAVGAARPVTRDQINDFFSGAAKVHSRWTKIEFEPWWKLNRADGALTFILGGICGVILSVFVGMAMGGGHDEVCPVGKVHSS